MVAFVFKHKTLLLYATQFFYMFDVKLFISELLLYYFFVCIRCFFLYLGMLHFLYITTLFCLSILHTSINISINFLKIAELLYFVFIESTMLISAVNFVYAAHPFSYSFFLCTWAALYTFLNSIYVAYIYCVLACTCPNMLATQSSTRRMRSTVLRGPHIDKRGREQLVATLAKRHIRMPYCLSPLTTYCVRYTSGMLLHTRTLHFVRLYSTAVMKIQSPRTYLVGYVLSLADGICAAYFKEAYLIKVGALCICCSSTSRMHMVEGNVIDIQKDAVYIAILDGQEKLLTVGDKVIATGLLYISCHSLLWQLLFCYGLCWTYAEWKALFYRTILCQIICVQEIRTVLLSVVPGQLLVQRQVHARKHRVRHLLMVLCATIVVLAVFIVWVGSIANLCAMSTIVVCAAALLVLKAVVSDLLERAFKKFSHTKQRSRDLRELARERCKKHEYLGAVCTYIHSKWLLVWGFSCLGATYAGIRHGAGNCRAHICTLAQHAETFTYFPQNKLQLAADERPRLAVAGIWETVRTTLHSTYTNHIEHIAQLVAAYPITSAVVAVASVGAMAGVAVYLVNHGTQIWNVVASFVNTFLHGEVQPALHELPPLLLPVVVSDDEHDHEDPAPPHTVSKVRLLAELHDQPVYEQKVVWPYSNPLPHRSLLIECFHQPGPSQIIPQLLNQSSSPHSRVVAQQISQSSSSHNMALAQRFIVNEQPLQQRISQQGIHVVLQEPRISQHGIHVVPQQQLSPEQPSKILVSQQTSTTTHIVPQQQTITEPQQQPPLSMEDVDMQCILRQYTVSHKLDSTEITPDMFAFRDNLYIGWFLELGGMPVDVATLSAQQAMECLKQVVHRVEYTPNSAGLQSLLDMCPIEHNADVSFDIYTCVTYVELTFLVECLEKVSVLPGGNALLQDEVCKHLNELARWQHYLEHSPNVYQKEIDMWTTQTKCYKRMFEVLSKKDSI